MSEETPQLKRDTTMTVTAEEGAAFLEKHGKVDEDVKTRAQQKQVEEAVDETVPKLARTTTMAETAKEGEAILDGAELGKTRSETAKQDEDTTEDEKPQIQRATTMEVTAKEGAEILEANGGVVDGTRSETKKIEDAIKASEDDKVDEAAEPETNGNCEETAKLKRKSTMVATAEEGEEFLKKQKFTDSEEAIPKEVEAKTA